MSVTVRVKQCSPDALPPSWPTRSISTNPGTASSQSAQVRIGICDFSSVPGLVWDRPRESSFARSGASWRSIVADGGGGPPQATRPLDQGWGRGEVGNQMVEIEVEGCFNNLGADNEHSPFAAALARSRVQFVGDRGAVPGGHPRMQHNGPKTGLSEDPSHLDRPVDLVDDDSNTRIRRHLPVPQRQINMGRRNVL